MLNQSFLWICFHFNIFSEKKAKKKQLLKLALSFLKNLAESAPLYTTYVRCANCGKYLCCLKEQENFYPRFVCHLFT